MKKRKPRPLPDVLTKEEKIVLLARPNRKAPTGNRNYAMIFTFLHMGFRVSEILTLRPADIDFATGKTHIKKGKGNKDRVIYAPESVLDVIGKWMTTRPPIGEDKPIFTTLDGKSLTRTYIHEMVSRYAKKAGIKKRVYPHLLRHSFATDFYRQTLNIAELQKALGHSDIKTTMIYTHIAAADLSKSMRGFNPL